MTNTHEATGSKLITPSDEEDCLSFDDVVTIIQPKVEFSSVAVDSFQESTSFTHSNGNALVGINHVDAGTTPLSFNSKSEIIFGPPLIKPKGPHSERSYNSFKATNLVPQSQITNQEQDLPIGATTILSSATGPSFPENSSRSSSPDLIQFTPPKKSLPKKESPRNKKPSQIHATKPKFGVDAFALLNPFSSIPRISGDFKKNSTSPSVNRLTTVEPKHPKQVITTAHHFEGTREIPRDIVQATTNNKHFPGRVAVMELPPEVDLLASQQSVPAARHLTRSLKMPNLSIPSLLSEKPEDDSPAVALSSPTGQDPPGRTTLEVASSYPSKSSASLSSTSTAQVPMPFALATRTTDDVFAELRRPLHAQASQIQIDTKLSSSGNTSGTNDTILNNSNISDQIQQPAVEDDDEEDEDDFNQPAPDIKRISARKQKNAAIFDIFLKKAALEAAEKQANGEKGEKTSHANDEVIQSTRWLIEQAEKQHIISSPRDYQLELFEKAKKQNIIAVLDTGIYQPPHPLFLDYD